MICDGGGGDGSGEIGGCGGGGGGCGGGGCGRNKLLMLCTNVRETRVIRAK